MHYKDLIFKITSEDNTKQSNKADSINPIKKALQSKDILIGIMSDEKTKLSEDSLKTLKREVERTLTVLLNSPISNSFGFLPYDKETLSMVIDTFPEKRIQYITDEDEYETVKKIKEEKLNLKIILKSQNKLNDFTKKINYLVTINHELEPSLLATLQQNEVMVFPIDIYDLSAPNGQKEKLVKPDGTGWIYNSASGMWIKTWGNDGMQQIPGW